MSDLATVHQSTTRWIESGDLEASAQAMNLPAVSGSLPLALATNAQPPPTVTYLPPLGTGSLNMPNGTSGEFCFIAAIPQMPQFWMAQYPAPRLAGRS